MKGWKLKARGAPCWAAQQRDLEPWVMGGGAGGTPEPSSWWFPMCSLTCLSPTRLHTPIPGRRRDGVKSPPHPGAAVPPG